MPNGNKLTVHPLLGNFVLCLGYLDIRSGDKFREWGLNEISSELPEKGNFPRFVPRCVRISKNLGTNFLEVGALVGIHEEFNQKSKSSSYRSKT